MKNFNLNQEIKFKQGGVTLIELMVALVIGLIVSLAVYTVLSSNEGRKRTITSTNDIDQVGAYVSYQLDKAIRSAGSGFSAGLNPRVEPRLTASYYTFGCALNITLSGSALLPKAAAFASPFNVVSQQLRLAPVIIVNGTTDKGDVIITAQGSAGLSESVNNLTDVPTNSSVKLMNVAGFEASSNVLLIGAKSDSTQNPGTPCLLEQVTSGFVPTAGSGVNLPLKTTSSYYLDPSSAGYAIGSTAIALNMGMAPAFNMFAVGNNNTLLRYDLLLAEDTSSTSINPNPSEFAESIYSLQAVYGVDDGSGLVWTAPTGTYASSSLLDGSAAANQKLRNIKAIRVAIVTRTNLYEKDEVSESSVDVFTSIGMDTTINLSDQHYRYKVTENTIPIRNALAL